MDLVYFRKFGFYLAYDVHNKELLKIQAPDWEQAPAQPPEGEGDAQQPQPSLITKLADYDVVDYFFHRIFRLDETSKPT